MCCCCEYSAGVKKLPCFHEFNMRVRQRRSRGLAYTDEKLICNMRWDRRKFIYITFCTVVWVRQMFFVVVVVVALQLASRSELFFLYSFRESKDRSIKIDLTYIARKTNGKKGSTIVGAYKSFAFKNIVHISLGLRFFFY